jgi:hypothetical protein
MKLVIKKNYFILNQSIFKYTEKILDYFNNLQNAGS